MSLITLNSAGSGDRTGIIDATTEAKPDPVTGMCTLATGTYYFLVGGHDAPTPGMASLLAIHLKWSSALRATITLEDCNFPSKVGNANSGLDDVTGFDATAGSWLPYVATTATVSVTGATATGLSLGTITAAGGAMYHIPNVGSRRMRVKVVVATGGTLRVNVRGKVA